MSYLVILAGLVGLCFCLDLSLPLSAGIILVALSIWGILMNRKLSIPKW